jgi:hypothetical protein
VWSIISVNAAAAILAAATYGMVRRPFLAAFIAAALVAIGLQVFVLFELGYMDPLWPVAAIISFASAFVVGLAVVFTWRFLANRKPRKEQAD